MGLLAYARPTTALRMFSNSPGLFKEKDSVNALIQSKKRSLPEGEMLHVLCAGNELLDSRRILNYV